MADVVQRFEEWCEGLNNPSQRNEAEQRLMEFRKTPGALRMAFEILRHTKKPVAQFHSILLLRECAIQNWPTLSSNDQQELKTQIWNFTWNGLQGGSFEPVVLSQLVRVNAVLIKRGFLEVTGVSDWENISRQLNSRLQTGDLNIASAALCLFEAVLEEFSTEKASGLGQSLDFHRRCHKQFEQSGIKQIMAVGCDQLAKLTSAVSEFSSRNRFISPQELRVLKATVSLVSQCIAWNDSVPWSSRPGSSGLNSGSNESSRGSGSVAQAIFLSESWRSFLFAETGDSIGKGTVQLYQSLRYQFSNVAAQQSTEVDIGAFADTLHELRELLMTLARVRGLVFQDERTHAEYGTKITDGVRELLQNPLVPLSVSARVVDTFEPGAWPQDNGNKTAATLALQEAGASEMLDLCLVLRLVCGSCSPDVLFRAGAIAFQKTISFLCELGVALLEATLIAADVVVNVDSVWAMEALGHILHVEVGLADWYERNVVNPIVYGRTNSNARAAPGLSTPPVDESLARLMLESSARLYDCSVRQRLLLARKEMEARARGVSDEVDQDDQFEDASVVEDHMVAVAHVGRVCSHVSVPLLQSLLNSKHSELVSLSQGGQMHGLAGMRQAEGLQEELCWLVQFTGYLLADANEGERGTIPAPIAALCLEADRHELENPVLKLSITLLEALERESSRLVASGQGGGEDRTLSPLVAEKTAWAVARWAHSYLFPDETLYETLQGYENQPPATQQSQIFARGNGKMMLPRSIQRQYSAARSAARDGDPQQTGGAGVAAFLVQVVSRYLASRWSHETDLMQACIDLLMVLVENPGARQSLVQHSALHDLVEAHVAAVTRPNLRDWAPLVGLEGELHGQLLGCLLRTLVSETPTVLAKSFEYLTSGIELRLNNLCGTPSKSRGSTWALDVLRVLSLLRAIVQHSNGGVSAPCRELYLRTLVQQLPLAADCANEYGTSGSDKATIASNFLAGFRTFLDSQLPFAKDAEVPIVSEACYSMLTTVFLKMASRSESGVAGSIENVVEVEENVWAQDLHAVLQCLTLLSEKDMFDFADEVDTNSAPGATIGNMVVCGLTQVVPHMTLKLLQFPNVTREYFRLLIAVIESYPKQIAGLDCTVFASIIRSLEFGINHPVGVLARRSLEAVYQLAHFHVTETANGQGQGIQQQLQHDQKLLVRLLQEIFQLLLVPTLDTSLISPIANALLALVSCEQQAYQSMVAEFLQTQTQLSPGSEKKVSEVFAMLFRGVKLSFDRPNRIKFQKNTEEFRKLLLGMQVLQR